RPLSRSTLLPYTTLFRSSQGDIERRSGLLRTYVSRVEGGYTGPSLPTLEKFARALGVEPYQLLFHNSGLPKAARLPEQNHLTKPDRKSTRLNSSHVSISY